jgi:SAM-dependent methyltransferase
MSDRWHEYIRGGIERAGGPIPFALEQWQFLAPVVERIRRSTPQGGRILEVGAGSAIFPSLLAHFGYQVTAIDNDERIVRLGREMAEYFRAPISVACGEAHDLRPWHGGFDLVYSLGVVEHFDASETQQLLTEQSRCAPMVIAVIPSKHTHLSGSHTDERIYTRAQFARVVRGAGLDVRESFVYGDLPTWSSRQMARILPKVVTRPVRHLFTYGMGICVVARKRG